MRKTEPPSKDLSVTDFAEEVTEQIKAKSDLALNAKVIKTQNKMLGELLNITA